MIATKKLYRVLVETSTPQDRDRGQRKREVLYCGYDRDESRRVYHESKPADYAGSYTCRYRNTIAQVMDCD